MHEVMFFIMDQVDKDQKVDQYIAWRYDHHDWKAVLENWAASAGKPCNLHNHNHPSPNKSKECYFNLNINSKSQEQRHGPKTVFQFEKAKCQCSNDNILFWNVSDGIHINPWRYIWFTDLVFSNICSAVSFMLPSARFISRLAFWW